MNQRSFGSRASFGEPHREGENTVPRLTLLELNGLVRQSVELSMPHAYWVEAELSELRESRGHCYMELVQKDANGNTPVAKASAKCWASVWQLVAPHFERVTGQALAPGMKVLLLVKAEFHVSFGFSWTVSDIDPTYTMGDMARRRREILQQLEAEGVIRLQKELALPRCCNRIAVISSQGAAGYGDFENQLRNNDRGLVFHTRLFPAVMQGEGVEQSIIAALDDIYDRLCTSRAAADDDAPFHCVVIIRGGGATSDLSGFDTLALAENIANFPLPVITGIGHERDTCIPDLVSHHAVKTPTAAAAYLIEHQSAALDELQAAERLIVERTKAALQQSALRLEHCERQLPQLFSAACDRHKAALDRCALRLQASVVQNIRRALAEVNAADGLLRAAVRRKTENERHRLDLLALKTDSLDPTKLLQRGYSITLRNGRAVKNAASLAAGDVLETRFATGSATSVVKKTKNH